MAGVSIKHLESGFSQAFNYNEKRVPHGITLDELLKTPIYLDSFPTPFIYTNSSPHSLKGVMIYKVFLNFVQSHPENKELQQCLFPIFCHIIMDFRSEKDEESIENFAKEYIKTLPTSQQRKAQKFVEDESKFRKLACLFSTQRYIIKCSPTTYGLLNNFVNDSRHSTLKRYLSQIIIPIPTEDVITTDVRAFRFSFDSPSQNLSILQARIRGASHAILSTKQNNIFAVIQDQNVIRIDTNKRETTTLMTHPAVITCLSLSNSGNILLSGDMSAVVNLWTPTTSVRFESAMNLLWCSSFMPKGGMFGLGFGDGLVKLFDSARHQETRVFSGHIKPVYQIGFHPNCELMGSSSSDYGIRIWDVRTAESVRLFVSKPLLKPKVIAFSPNGKYFSFYDGSINICDIGSGKITAKKSISEESIVELTFSQDNQYMYASNNSGGIYSYCWDRNEIEPISILHEQILSCKISETNELQIVTLLNS